MEQRRKHTKSLETHREFEKENEQLGVGEEEFEALVNQRRGQPIFGLRIFFKRKCKRKKVKQRGFFVLRKIITRWWTLMEAKFQRMSKAVVAAASRTTTDGSPFPFWLSFFKKFKKINDVNACADVFSDST